MNEIDNRNQRNGRGRRVSMKTVSDLKVKIFADGADKAGMLEMYAKRYIKGFTTNPTLMRKQAFLTTALLPRRS